MNEAQCKKILEEQNPEWTPFAKCVSGVQNDVAENLCAIAGLISDQAQDLCKSEIEKLLFVAYAMRLEFFKLFGSVHGGNAIYSILSPDHQSPELERPESFHNGVWQFDVIATQYRIGTYCADIVVKRWVWERHGFLVTPKIVVECDGHDFHERTKEQAAHDKKRDRFMQTEGYQILRFTGSEIFRDPGACGEQINECLDKHIYREYMKQRASLPAAEKVGAA